MKFKKNYEILRKLWNSKKIMKFLKNYEILKKIMKFLKNCEIFKIPPKFIPAFFNDLVALEIRLGNKKVALKGVKYLFFESKIPWGGKNFGQPFEKLLLVKLSRPP